MDNCARVLMLHDSDTVHGMMTQSDVKASLSRVWCQISLCVGLRWIAKETTLEETFTSTIQFDHYSKFCYVPFSMEKCLAMMRKDLAQNVARIPDFEDPRINHVLPFGWNGFIRVENYDDTRVQTRLQMTKEWMGTPKANCEIMWDFDIKETDPKHVFWEQHCAEILQHVSDDVKVFRRRIACQGWTSWSVFLLYRTQVGDSYLIGCVPLPLWGNSNLVRTGDAYGESFLGGGETLAILPLHHLFVPVEENHGTDICTRVFRWGAAACEQKCFMPLFQRCAVESILRFERLILFPLVNNLIEK